MWKRGFKIIIHHKKNSFRYSKKIKINTKETIQTTYKSYTQAVKYAEKYSRKKPYNIQSIGEYITE